MNEPLWTRLVIKMILHSNYPLPHKQWHVTVHQTKTNNTSQFKKPTKKNFWLIWLPLWFMRSGSSDLGNRKVLCFVLPYLLNELSLKTSSSFVLLMGMVPSAHLPYRCHNWGICMSFYSDFRKTLCCYQRIPQDGNCASSKKGIASKLNKTSALKT